MTERNGNAYLMRFLDGPCGGETIMVDMWGWPLPERIVVGKTPASPTGRVMAAYDDAVNYDNWPEGTAVYLKVRQSALPDDAGAPKIMRGAEYEVQE